MRSKHISSFEEVKARNAGEETQYDKARGLKRGEIRKSKARAARSGKATKEEEAEESEEEVKPVVWLLLCDSQSHF